MKHSTMLALALSVSATAAHAAGISDDVVRIGVLTDMSGAYSGNVGPGSVLATKLAIEDVGGKVLGSSRYPFPGNDFASFLLSAQGSGADAVGFASAGADLQNEIKQAREFGLAPKQKLVAMLMSITDVHGVGLDAAQGMTFAETFYWDMDDETRAFAKRFEKELGKMPTALQAGQYSAVLNYLRAVEKAGTDEVGAVMKALHEMPIHDAFARNATLRPDGKLIHDTYVVQVKTPEESKGPWDYYKIVKTVSGDQSFMPLSESQCKLAKPGS